MIPKRTILLALLLAICFSAQAQDAAKKDVLGALRYRHIGPIGNRLTSVVGIPGQPNIYYVGAAFGRPPTEAFTGIPFSIRNQSHRLARSRSHRQIQTSSGQAPVNHGYAAISR
jgi:hypothetical protein